MCFVSFYDGTKVSLFYGSLYDGIHLHIRIPLIEV
nr:MAG TPA: hypothetical protein [Caudoviricetes sp.]